MPKSNTEAKVQENSQVKQAEAEIVAICEKYKVNVIPYIHQFGPRLAVIPINETQTDSKTGQDADQGRSVSPSVNKPVRGQSEDKPRTAPVQNS